MIVTGMSRPEQDQPEHSWERYEIKEVYCPGRIDRIENAECDVDRVLVPLTPDSGDQIWKIAKIRSECPGILGARPPEGELRPESIDCTVVAPQASQESAVRALGCSIINDAARPRLCDRRINGLIDR